jgi:hypothetical protein
VYEDSTHRAVRAEEALRLSEQKANVVGVGSAQALLEADA